MIMGYLYLFFVRTELNYQLNISRHFIETLLISTKIPAFHCKKFSEF